MTKPSGHICARLLVFGSIVSAQSDSAAIAKAEAILKNLQDGKFAEIVAQFDPVMAKARRSGELKGYRASDEAPLNPQILSSSDPETLKFRILVDRSPADDRRGDTAAELPAVERRVLRLGAHAHG